MYVALRLLVCCGLITLAAWMSPAGAFESLSGAPLPSWFKTYTPTHAFDIERSTLVMRDGTELSVTYFKPVPSQAAERFPVVLEMLPYRKDDYFYSRDYPIYRYLAERGIGGARIDIGGTGSSGGRLVDREYSDAELADLEEAIGKVATLPWSNGKVGMQGISWSAFNALMMAMRNPPALKAILVLHGSEDLYANDVHNIDGALHLTGSSIMPNKRNPDVIELMRATHASVAAARTEIEQLLSLPSGYHRDLQASKGAIFHGFGRGLPALELLPALLANLEWREDRLRAAIDSGMYATDVAVEAAVAGVPFREAYKAAAASADSAGDGRTPESSLAARVSPGSAADLRLDELRTRLDVLGS